MVSRVSISRKNRAKNRANHAPGCGADWRKVIVLDVYIRCLYNTPYIEYLQVPTGNDILLLISKSKHYTPVNHIHCRLKTTAKYNILLLHSASSSNGQDARFSSLKSEFDSPWGYQKRFLTLRSLF